MKINFFLLLFVPAFYSTAQIREHYFPVWTFHQANANIHGLSVGISQDIPEQKNVVTNGVRVELFGLGILLPLIPQSPIAETEERFREQLSEPPSEKVNGIALSLTGTGCDCRVNGFTAGLIGQFLREVNGVSASYLSLVHSHKGAQLALVGSANYQMYGLQAGFVGNSSVRARGVPIGIYNEAKDLRGIQIGVWNKNGRRSLPIINWQFKKAETT